jgi:predicted enzyme related to lactoylglutathione lyase
MKKNSVAHFEIYADDPGKLEQFYKSMFDWKIEHMAQMDYWLIKTVDTDDKGMPTQTGGINGGMLKRPTGYPGNAWVNYVNVESLDASVEKAQKLGAKVTKGRSPVPGMGWFAMLIDPQGNHFALWQSDANAK